MNTPPANTLPYFSGRTPRFPVEDFSDREAVADTLQHPQRFEEIRLSARVGPDEQVHPPQGQIHLAQALEVLDDDAFDHVQLPTRHGRNQGSVLNLGTAPPERTRASRPLIFT